jgi:sporulation protein YlmC with PRC-barrel domain
MARIYADLWLVVAPKLVTEGDATMEPSANPSQTSHRSLIESNRVEGTKVFDPNGTRIGKIDHLILEKTSGKAVYAVMTFGGFVGLSKHTHLIPWEKLRYDVARHGYVTSITEAELANAPDTDLDEDFFLDGQRRREREVRDYWDVPHYGGL